MRLRPQCTEYRWRKSTNHRWHSSGSAINVPVRRTSFGRAYGAGTGRRPDMPASSGRWRVSGRVLAGKKSASLTLNWTVPRGVSDSLNLFVVRGCRVAGVLAGCASRAGRRRSVPGGRSGPRRRSERGRGSIAICAASMWTGRSVVGRCRDWSRRARLWCNTPTAGSCGCRVSGRCWPSSASTRGRWTRRWSVTPESGRGRRRDPAGRPRPARRDALLGRLRRRDGSGRERRSSSTLAKHRGPAALRSRWGLARRRPARRRKIPTVVGN